MRTCARFNVPNTCTTDDPGVWIAGAVPPRKICAVGVQIRRAITGHGVGLNVVDERAPERYRRADGSRADGYLSWGFERIVACGLEGMEVTWLRREGMAEGFGTSEVANVFVEELAGALQGVDGVDEMDEMDVDV